MTIMILSTAQKIKLSDLLGFKGRGKSEERAVDAGKEEGEEECSKARELEYILIKSRTSGVDGR